MEEVQYFAPYQGNCSHDITIPEMTLPEMLEQSVKKFPQAYVASFYGRKLTYEQLWEAVQIFAAHLQKLGVQKGDRVAIQLPNCPQYLISYYGILAAGGIVTQLNPMLSEKELEYILKDCQAKIIILIDALYPKIKSVQKNTAIETVMTVSLGDPFHPKLPDLALQSVLSVKNDFLPVKIDPKNDIAVLQYTGGTTGRSKGAMLTHFNLLANIVQTYEFYKSELNPGNEKCLTVIPLFHVFGMTSCMNFSIFCGNEMILLPKFDLQEVLETIKKEQPTVFPGVPTMYVAITNHPRDHEYQLDSMKLCNSGSAPMPIEVMKEFERKTGAKIVEGYGLSEASPTTHCNPPFAARKAGTVGIGFPRTAYKIVDLESGTKEMPPGEPGELVIKGPQVMKGYWNQPEETAMTLRNGWLYTGDIAKMDMEGYVSIIDRKKDMIIASGYNIYPRDVEEVLYEHPAVQEAVVIGVPDAYRGETVKAVIVLKEGATTSEKELIDHCKQHLSAYKVPKIIEFRNELPKTNIGKILRRAIREESMKKQ